MLNLKKSINPASTAIKAAANIPSQYITLHCLPDCLSYKKKQVIAINSDMIDVVKIIV